MNTINKTDSAISNLLASKAEQNSTKPQNNSLLFARNLLTGQAQQHRAINSNTSKLNNPSKLEAIWQKLNLRFVHPFHLGWQANIENRILAYKEPISVYQLMCDTNLGSLALQLVKSRNNTQVFDMTILNQSSTSSDSTYCNAPITSQSTNSIINREVHTYRSSKSKKHNRDDIHQFINEREREPPKQKTLMSILKLAIKNLIQRWISRTSLLIS